MTISRRALLAAAPFGLTAQLFADESGRGDAPRTPKLIVVGGHPDDPEGAAGGTLVKFAEAGWETVTLYLTTGEAGIPGTAAADAAKIRRAEAEAACEILRCRPVFFGQIDGAAVVTNAEYERFARVVDDESPDLVLTHWPVDTHRDHRAASLMTFDAWHELGFPFALGYHEVLTGEQTQAFNPTAFVDVSDVIDRKHLACLAHVSQDGPDIVRRHSRMSRFRGLQVHAEHAEAFVMHEWSARLPGLEPPVA